jgi:DNA primase
VIQDAVQRVKTANDIVDVVGGYLTLRQTGRVFKSLCPFHDDRRPSFDVDPDRQRYRCWSCGEYGDVISFVQRIERLDFMEAMDLLARRAGIAWRDSEDSSQSAHKAKLLEACDWAQKQFQEALWDRLVGKGARDYLEDRGLEEQTLRSFGVGWAPPGGDWLLRRAQREGLDLELLDTLGILGRHDERLFDRFRERVIFPIRNPRGQTVGFGGRVLLGTPTAERAPKYYNSTDSALFTKSEQLFGLDLAREEAKKRGFLAVMEGYTDVLMAHQQGIGNVVATMGTALNHRHLSQLRRHTSQVVLVFDADAGGDGGVERALSLFAQQEMELRVARLPQGLDPCDWLLNEGPAPLYKALEEARDALTVAMDKWFPPGIEDRVGMSQAGLDRVLGLLGDGGTAGSAASVKRELLVGRLARRLGLREETLWQRKQELAKAPRVPDRREARAAMASGEPPIDEASMPLIEREMLAALVSHPEWVEEAASSVEPACFTHPVAKGLYEALLGLLRTGQTPGPEGLRPTLSHQMYAMVLRLGDMGQSNPEPREWFEGLVDGMTRRNSRVKSAIVREELGRLAHAGDHEAALEVLRRLQESARGALKP